MGRFEDLVEQAKEGDTDALDTLAEEFSGSALREQAEQASAFKSKYEEHLPVIRKARVDELVGKLDDDLREVGLGVDDFGDFDPDDLSLEQVQDKAKAKSEQVQATRLATAKEAGFDSYEEYQEALDAVKQSRQARQKGMEDVGGAAASSGGAPPGTSEPTLHDVGKEAFQTSKAEGRADDYALGDSIDAILAAQLPEAEE